MAVYAYTLNAFANLNVLPPNGQFSTLPPLEVFETTKVTQCQCKQTNLAKPEPLPVLKLPCQGPG